MTGAIERVQSVFTVSNRSMSAARGGSAFAAAMKDASAASAGSISADASKPSGASGPTANEDAVAKLKEALAAFKKEASLTPAERARRDVLKSMKLTEDGIKAMSPDERRATEQKIAEEVARRLRVSEAGEDQGAASVIL